MSTIEQLRREAKELESWDFNTIQTVETILKAANELESLQRALDRAQNAEQKTLGDYLALQESAQACNRYAQSQLESAQQRISELEKRVSDQCIRGMLTRLEREHNELRAAWENETGKPWIATEALENEK